MKYFEAFTGIAGFSKGIEQAYGVQFRQSDSDGHQPDTVGTGRRIDERRNGSKDAVGMPECVGFAEIGKTPSAILRYHYPDIRNYGDATAIVCDELPDFDLFCGGFPCQSFSIAGKRQGFNEARGTLFFEIARILSHKRPRHFLLENVKGLLSADDGKVYSTILRILADLDYRVETVVLNSKDYGVPQNRERVFFIGHSSRECSGEILSFGESDGKFDEVQRTTGSERQRLSVDTESRDGDDECPFGKTSCGLEDRWNGRERHGDDSVTVGTLRTHKDGEGFREMQSGGKQPYQQNRVYETDGIAPASAAKLSSGSIAIPVLTPDRPTKRQNERRFKENGEESFTITAQDKHGVMVQAVDTKNVGAARFTDNVACLGANDHKEPKGVMLSDKRIRRLTPVETMRLQGFPDDWCDFGINEKGEVYAISDTGIYQCAGNAVTVNVIEAIITQMLDKGCLQ